MTIFVNDSELDATLEQEKTMGDVFSFLESDMEEHGATIVAVSIDGREIPVGEFDDMFATPIEKVKRVDIQTACARDVKAMLAELAVHLLPLADELEHIPVQFQTGGDAQAMKTVADFANSMELFFRLVPLCELFSEDFKSILTGDTSIAETAAEFRPILTEFLDAFDKTDMVLAGDIAEYEISPRLRNLTGTLNTLR